MDVRILAVNELRWKDPEFSKLNVPSPETVQNSNLIGKQCFDELKSSSTLTLHSDSNCFDNLFDLTNNFHLFLDLLQIVKVLTSSSREYRRTEFCLIRVVQVKISCLIFLL